MNEGLKKVGKHYQLPLPLKVLELKLPNNKSMALKRLVFEEKVWKESTILLALQNIHWGSNQQRICTEGQRIWPRRKEVVHTSSWCLPPLEQGSYRACFPVFSCFFEFFLFSCFLACFLGNGLFFIRLMSCFF